MKQLTAILLLFIALHNAGAQVNLSGTVVNATCASTCNGSITTTVSGGVPPYTYSWFHDGQNVSSQSNLCPGTYIVYVFDAQQNNDTDTFIVSSPPGSMKIDSISVFAVGCRSSAQTINVYGGGGTPPYQIEALVTIPPNPTQFYAFDSDVLDPFSGIRADGNLNIISITIKDANGCTDTVTPNSVFFRVNLNVGVVPPSCGLSNGVINVSPSTGTAPYTYAWNNGQTTNTISNLSEGNYSVTVTDANGCARHRNFELGNITCTGNIQGNAFLSLNTCNNLADVVDMPIKLMPEDRTVFTESDGSYIFTRVGPGSKTLSSPAINPLCPVGNAIPVSLAAGADANNNNFHIVYPSSCQDAAVRLFVSRDTLRAGNNRSTITMRVTNNSRNGSVVSGTAFLNIDANMVVNQSTITPGFSGSGNNFNWNYSLNPFESRTFSLEVTPLSSLASGTALSHNASLVPVGADCNTNNNLFVLNQVFQFSIAPYLPNAIRVLPRNTFSAADSFLTYTIFFQNTRKDTVYHVAVLDTLDASLDINSFKLLGSSHPCKIEVQSGRYLSAVFRNINLPDSLVDWSASHGFIQFSLMPKSNLNIGTQIKHKASVYFDFNHPLQTNEVTNTIAVPSVVSDVVMENINLYPNPVHDVLNIQIEKASIKCTIYSIQGKGITTVTLTAGLNTIDINAFHAGIYLMIIEDSNGMQYTKRIVKQ